MKNWLYLLAACAIPACTPGPQKVHSSDSTSLRPAGPSAVLDATTAIKHMKTEPGLEIQLVAAEPLTTTPVAMTFDEKGRMWVVEMTGYMPDTAGTGEDTPNGKVVILEDTTHDGVADTRKVIIDSLILPRAICLVPDGFLLAEPPNLWFVPVKNDVAGKKILVDNKYTEGGNVEHQPNGLLRAMDNWIYNAKSDKRYRRIHNKWVKQDTHFRGQWGLCQDNFGRLYSNNNSENLLGDYFPPGLGARNPNQRSTAGYDEKIVPDNRVWPIHATPGVNRGYMKGILDDSLRLVNMTAACSPLIYRGSLLGKAYDNNAFVAEPSGNLIKRNILQDSGYMVKGHQAYGNREFLASDDERFRPVSLYDAPDGALYFLDMYRGIIQHKTYLTPYLKEEIKSRALTNPLNCGRIYRIVPAGTKIRPMALDNNPDKLLALLENPNGWIRDKAQQMIIDHHYTQLIPHLKARLKQEGNTIGTIHVLWTLEGLGALQYADLAGLLHQQNPYIQAAAISALPAVNTKDALAALAHLESNVFLAPYIALILPYLPANDLQGKLITRYANDRYVADALINNNYGKEENLMKQLIAIHPDTTLVMYRHLTAVINDIEVRRKAKISDVLVKEYPRGAKLFANICQTCHGKDGDGIKSLAPPLNQSEIVTGEKNRLISIVLYGLTGPVNVNGKHYQAPEISADMPGIGANDEFNDKDIAEVISFIRNCWSNRATKVTEKDIQEIRKQYKGRQKPFTIEELK
jgi:mono/diheme cytochrome c family protein/glucose/arabinose dehydrogenase